MIIPHRMLSPDALCGVIEACVTREGTDYGAQEVPLATKVFQVQQQLRRRDRRSSSTTKPPRVARFSLRPGDQTIADKACLLARPLCLLSAAKQRSNMTVRVVERVSYLTKVCVHTIKALRGAHGASRSRRPATALPLDRPPRAAGKLKRIAQREQETSTWGQGHLVFQCNPDESQRLYWLGRQLAASRCNVGMPRPPQQANGGVA